jgi:WD40 repeat protein
MKLVAEAERSVFTEENFVKEVKFSPDGTCLLSNSSDHSLRLFEFNLEKASLSPSLQCKEAEDILDYCWYPSMQGNNPATCFFASTSKEQPIHLWDAYTGKNRANYTAYDTMDEPKAAFSVCFSPAGDKIYGGYNKSICMWDASFPGRCMNEYSTHSKNRKSNRQTTDDNSLNGIISVIACNPDYSGILACGSFNGGIGLYDQNMDPLCVLWGHDGGITHMKWSPCGNYLYSGGRKDNFIRCWDIRNTQDVIMKMPRMCETNQRLHFDIDPYGNYLTSGNQQGDILIYDLSNNGKLLQQINLHSDSCSSVYFHPSQPYIATSSGQRHGHFSIDEDEDKESIENSIKVWEFPYAYPQYESSSIAIEIESVEVESMHVAFSTTPHYLHIQNVPGQQQQRDDLHSLEPHYMQVKHDPSKT